MENENTKDNMRKTQSQKKFIIGATRLLDNHYDLKVHHKPWIAAGHLPDYKYDFDDTGLAYKPKKSQKLRFFRERHEQRLEVQQEFSNFRFFREYNNVMNNDIVITIEYCTNCSHHLGSTRHDEEKYSFFANELKRQILSQYPIIKVILKPLLFQESDQTNETVYLRTRIGALEVQLFSKNSQGDTTRETIFSKLQTKSWPSISKVVQKVALFLPKEDFIVRLIDPSIDSDQPQKREEKKENQNPSKLKGLKVIMRPKKMGNSMSNNLLPEFSTSPKTGDSNKFTSLGSSSRPTSGMMRPKSAISTASSRSYATLRTTGTEKIPSIAQEFIEAADEYGVIVFKGLPQNVYELEVLETHNYLPERRTINVFELLEKGEKLTEMIELRAQTMGFCRVKLTDRAVAISDATILIAKRDNESSGKTAVLREKEPHSGVFEFMIDPGFYMISITRIGYPERKEEIYCQQGENEFKFDMRQSGSIGSIPQSKPASAHSQNKIGSSNGIPGEGNDNGRPTSSKGRYANANNNTNPTLNTNPSKGSLPADPRITNEQKPVQQENKLRDSKEKLEKQPSSLEKPKGSIEDEGKQKQPERVKSALVKKIEIRVWNVDSEEPIAGVEIKVDEIGAKFYTNEDGKSLVPINKLNAGTFTFKHDNFYGLAEEYGGGSSEINTFHERVFYLIPKPTEADQVQIRFLPGSKTRCANFRVLNEELKSGGEGGAPNSDLQIKPIKNGKTLITLSHINIKLIEKKGVIRLVAEVKNIGEFSNPESTLVVSKLDSCEFIFPSVMPSKLDGKVTWDIGFISSSDSDKFQFFEINAYSNSEILQTSYLKEYQTLLNYLYNSKTDLKTLFGFKDKERIEKNGDILIRRENLLKSLDKYSIELKNIDHLLASAKNSEGLFSFEEINRRLKDLKGPFKFVEDQMQPSSQGGSSDDEYLLDDEQDNEQDDG